MSIRHPAFALFAILLFHVYPTAAKPLIQGYERFYSSGASAQGGAVLYSELGCANCHTVSTGIPARQGPPLRDIPKRLQYGWARKFLLSPGETSPGSNMPDLLGTLPAGQRDGAAEDLLAWLVSLGSKAKYKAFRHSNYSNGEALFRETGCAACHVDNQGFARLAEKTAFAVLDDTFKKSDQYWVDGRMPHFPMDAYRSADLAAYVTGFKGSDPRVIPDLPAWPKPKAGQVGRGKALAEQLGCASCHDVPGARKPSKLPMADHHNDFMSAHPSHPQYTLDAKQTESLVQFLSGQARVSPSDTLLAAFNCYACHVRDGKGGPTPKASEYFQGDPSLADSGKFPPPLTQVGFKLQPDWMEKVFSGEMRIRPYLKTQMPQYRKQARDFTRILQDADAQPGEKKLPEVADHLIGSKLLGTKGGFNCITCHQWGDRKSLGIQGIDLRTTGERLRPEWFRQYLLNPAAYRPGTLMPPFWPGGKSSIPALLDGDTEKQIATIWDFCKEAKGTPEGFPSHPVGAFELVPADKPLVQRGFFKGIGTKAILVGFPGGINLGYDSASSQPRLLWKGRFMDAYTIWFVRAAPFEAPLEMETHTFPAASSSDFRGYLLEADGSPTFLSGNSKETFRAKDGLLLRIVTPAAKEVAHPPGLKVASRVNGNTATYTYTIE